LQIKAINAFIRRILLKKRKAPRTRVNQRILYNTPEVRAIALDGSQLGVLPTEVAIQKAMETGHDLVEIAPTARPPVCRILDYGKYKYDEAKKLKAAKAKQHVVKLKEIKFHPKTDQNDYSYRLERGKGFLAKGCKLKATVVFRGRELSHKEYGARWLKQMEIDLEGLAQLDSPIKQEGRNMSAIFSPIKVTPVVTKDEDSSEENE